MNILNLPNVMLIQIFEYLPYEEVAKKRLICKKIDMICQHILNCGFNKVVKQHTISLKRIKALLPRRESERRNHCLARHADILTCIETRISMLSMTYSKYMDLNLCCFIPGRVLDEIFRILRLISKTTKPLRPHEVLQELRDISSMAIEHFDEKISHSLKKTFVDTNTQMYMSSVGASGSSALVNTTRNVCCDQMRQRVNLLLGLGQTAIDAREASLQSRVPKAVEQAPAHGAHRCEEARATMTYCKKVEQEYKKGISKNCPEAIRRLLNSSSTEKKRNLLLDLNSESRRILPGGSGRQPENGYRIHWMKRMLHVQTTQSRRLHQSLATISELNMQINELKKRMEDMDAKNRELSASIKQLNGETTAPSTPQSTATAQEYSNSEEISEIMTEVATAEEDNLTATAKRRIDEPPLEEEVRTADIEANSAKKAKIE